MDYLSNKNCISIFKMKYRFEIEWNFIEMTLFVSFIRLASYFVKWIRNEEEVVSRNIKTKYCMKSKSVLTYSNVFLINRLRRIE